MTSNHLTITSSHDIIAPAEKDVPRVGEEQVNVKADLQDNQLKSRLDKLTLWKSAWTFRKAVLIAALAGFSAVTDGYQTQISGSIVANAGFKAQFSQGHLSAGKPALEAKWVSAFSGIASAGQVIGQFSVPWASEYLGRRGAMFVVMGALLIAAIIESVATTCSVWTVARLFAGMGIGGVQASLPVYINEQSPVQIRGLLLVAFSLWSNLGSLIASTVLQARSESHPNDYKTSIYTQFGMVGFSALIFVCLPESAWWAVRKDKLDYARKILTRVYGGIQGYDLEAELSIMIATVEQQREWDRQNSQQRIWTMLQGLNLKRFLIGCWPKVLQLFVGLAVFSSNAAYFFDLAGNDDPFLVTVILGVVGLAACVVDAICVDRFGRRFMTVMGFSGACFGITLIAIIGCFDYESKSLGSVLVFGGVVANFFNTVQSSTSYAYLTEMPELRFRARATGWGLAYCNLYAVLINFTLPLMLEAWSVRAAFFFVATGVPGTILAYFIMPESMRRSPAEIQELFTDRVPLRKWKGYRTAVERDLDARQELQAV